MPTQQVNPSKTQQLLVVPHPKCQWWPYRFASAMPRAFARRLLSLIQAQMLVTSRTNWLTNSLSKVHWRKFRHQFLVARQSRHSGKALPWMCAIVTALEARQSVHGCFRRSLPSLTLWIGTLKNSHGPILLNWTSVLYQTLGSTYSSGRTRPSCTPHWKSVVPRREVQSPAWHHWVGFVLALDIRHPARHPQLLLHRWPRLPTLLTSSWRHWHKICGTLRLLACSLRWQTIWLLQRGRLNVSR